MKREKCQRLNVEKRSAEVDAGDRSIGAPLRVASVPVLPAVGLSKWSQIQPFIPFCRETWRKLVLAGKAPQAIRLSENCTVYKNEEIHRYLADPLNYRSSVAQDAA